MAAWCVGMLFPVDELQEELERDERMELSGPGCSSAASAHGSTHGSASEAVVSSAASEASTAPCQAAATVACQASSTPLATASNVLWPVAPEDIVITENSGAASPCQSDEVWQPSLLDISQPIQPLDLSPPVCPSLAHLEYQAHAAGEPPAEWSNGELDISGPCVSQAAPCSSFEATMPCPDLPLPDRSPSSASISQAACLDVSVSACSLSQAQCLDNTSSSVLPMRRRERPTQVASDDLRGFFGGVGC